MKLSVLAKAELTGLSFRYTPDGERFWLIDTVMFTSGGYSLEVNLSGTRPVLGTYWERRRIFYDVHASDLPTPVIEAVGRVNTWLNKWNYEREAADGTTAGEH